MLNHGDVDRWSFLAEGKMHLILIETAHDSADNHACCSGLRVLKVQKLFKSNESDDSTSDSSYERSFVQNNMVPWFSNHAITLSVPVRLSPGFIEGIILKTSTQRPVGRIKACNQLRLALVGHAEPNFNFVHKNIPLLLSSPLPRRRLSFDLKVKCGLLSNSPFVPIDRELKLRHSRFALMQLFKLGNKLRAAALLRDGVAGSNAQLSIVTDAEPAWGVFSGLSTYDPTGLCSGDSVQTRDALTALVVNPQNNLKVCAEGRHVFGWDSAGTAATLASRCAEFLNDGVSAADGSGTSALDELLDAVSSILCAEDTLKRLQGMQRLDLLDVEGAAAVFSRLEALLGGREAAERRLIEAFAESLDSDTITAIAKCVSKSEDSTVVHSTAVPLIVARLVDLRVSRHTPPELRVARLAVAYSLVNEASETECVLLLRLWMLALVAKDASVIVALETCDIAGFGASRLGMADRQVVLQAENHAGVVRVPIYSKVSRDSDNADRVMAYCVSLIDVGPKAVQKVWRKALKEAELCVVCAEAHIALLN